MVLFTYIYNNLFVINFAAVRGGCRMKNLNVGEGDGFVFCTNCYKYILKETLL